MTNVCVAELHYSTCQDRDCDDAQSDANYSSNDFISRYVHAVQASRIFINIGVIRAVALAVRPRRGGTHRTWHRGPVRVGGLSMFPLDMVLCVVVCCLSNIAVESGKDISTSPC